MKTVFAVRRKLQFVNGQNVVLELELCEGVDAANEIRTAHEQSLAAILNGSKVVLPTEEEIPLSEFLQSLGVTGVGYALSERSLRSALHAPESSIIVPPDGRH